MRDTSTEDLCSELMAGAVREFGGGPQNLWKAVYCTLMWYETIDADTGYPHIIDADKLHRPKDRAMPTPWQKRARMFEGAVAAEFGCDTQQLRTKLDRLMRHPKYAGKQRQNPLGSGFVTAIKYGLNSFGSHSLTYESECRANEVFPGIRLPGRSSNPRIDLVAWKRGDPVAIISAKWSLRHDRIGDVVSECPIYKAASRRYRQKLLYYVATNEFDGGRLSKVLSDDCVDGVVHVRRDLVMEMWKGQDRLAPLQDLVDLLHSTRNW